MQKESSHHQCSVPQPAISVFNLQVLHCMLLLPDNPAFIVELGNRSALLHTLLNRVVAALA